MAPPAILWTREVRPGLTEYVLDCRHATTMAATYTPAGRSHPLSEAEVIAAAQLRHEATCRCARRYVRGVES